MVDLIAVLMTELKNNAAVTALVGTRVFGQELPPGESASMPRKAIVVGEAPAFAITGPSYAPIIRPSYDIWCYGENFTECDKLVRAVHDLLKYIGLAASHPKIKAADRNGTYARFREPDKQWPIIVFGWDVVAREEAA